MGLRAEGVALRSDGLDLHFKGEEPVTTGRNISAVLEVVRLPQTLRRNAHYAPELSGDAGWMFATATGQADQYKIGLQRVSRPWT
jgi:hypothetical protein